MFPRRSVPPRARSINEFKVWAEARYQELSAEIERIELEARNKSEQVDITMPGTVRPMGSLHPITLVKNQIIDVFSGMGFEIYEGPEIEDDDHNFTRLNVPKDHPARDMQDTFYLAEEHRSCVPRPAAARSASWTGRSPPSRCWSPAACSAPTRTPPTLPCSIRWRAWLWIRASPCAICRECSTSSSRRCSAQSVKTRLRPSYFPFTEPSVEVDVSCFECGGKGCPLCKHTGWIEVLGAGVVHHSVLENCGIDPNVYSGFAFGIGIERIAMLKYGINNIGLMFENDLRFLKQFKD